MINETPKIGFIYTTEHIRSGKVIAVSDDHNLVPTEGLNSLLAVNFKGGAQQSNWYIGLFEGNYNPGPGAAAATIAAAATECTAYAGAARKDWIGSAPAGGSTSNADARAEFTFVLDPGVKKMIYGGFLISDSTKGGVLGVLASVVRFSSPKEVENGDLLRIAAGTTLVSV